jgi:hypothetical protein
MRLGQWSQAEQLTSDGLELGVEGDFAVTLLEVRAEVAVQAGRLDDAAARSAAARRIVGDLADQQFSQPLASPDDPEHSATIENWRAELRILAGGVSPGIP